MNKQLLLVASIILYAAPVSAEFTIEELISQSRLQEGPVAVVDLPGWNGANKVLITQVGDDEAKKLQALLPNIELVHASSTEDAIKLAADADAIVGSCDERLVDAAKSLIWIQIFWAGAESCLRVPRVRSGDVVLTNMQKMSAPVIGEHAVAMALALARGLPSFVREMQEGGPLELYTARSSMVPLHGKTMLVLGLGGIGTEAGKRAAGLGMRVIGTRNSSREGPEFVDYVGLSDEMLTLAAEADVIVNALPLTEATKGLVGPEFFAATKSGAFFVNVGRGATVDTDALTRALESGHLAGAGLDVTDPEPLPRDHPLWQFENVIITPHVAGRGGERQRHMTLLVENLRRFSIGGRLLNVVDPDKGY